MSDQPIQRWVKAPPMPGQPMPVPPLEWTANHCLRIKKTVSERQTAQARAVIKVVNDHPEGIAPIKIREMIGVGKTKMQSIMRGLKRDQHVKIVMGPNGRPMLKPLI